MTTTTITKTITEITITILIVTTNMAITMALLIGGNSGRHAAITMDKTTMITITTKCNPHGGVSKMKDNTHTHTHTRANNQTRDTNLETQIVVFLFCIFLNSLSFYITDIWGEREGQGNPEEEGKGALLFVYIWTLVIFAGLAYLGNTTGMAVNKLESMRWILLGFANYCFVIIVLLIALEGVESEGREMEETGFYGQTAVLLLMTCIFAMIQSIVFVSWTTKRLKHLKVMEEQQSSSNTEKSDEYVAVEYDNSPPAPPGYKITF